jgi:hypothetical protein
MTPDHRFIDSDGTEYSGCDQVRRGWESYFAMVPDYKISVKDVFARDNTVVLLGITEGTFENNGTLDAENHWEVPAAWRVLVEGDRVAAWQLYVNPIPMQEIMKRIDLT